MGILDFSVRKISRCIVIWSSCNVSVIAESLYRDINRIISNTVPRTLDLFQRSFWKHLSTKWPHNNSSSSADLITVRKHCRQSPPSQRDGKIHQTFPAFQNPSAGREGEGGRASIIYQISNRITERTGGESPQLKTVACFLQQPKKHQEKKGFLSREPGRC